MSSRSNIPFGLTDCKIISANTQKQNFIWAISGPSTSYGRFPAFNWTQFSDHSHLGMPDKFDFPWVKVTIHDPNELKLSEEKIVEVEM